MACYFLLGLYRSVIDKLIFKLGEQRKRKLKSGFLNPEIKMIVL